MKITVNAWINIWIIGGCYYLVAPLIVVQIYKSVLTNWRKQSTRLVFYKSVKLNRLNPGKLFIEARSHPIQHKRSPVGGVIEAILAVDELPLHRIQG
ncbi:hypothetical protein, partial [Formivibrio citricus]|uniref:hypothetical protein n=1 Tax=Formivibrio citricus TaxID=83765 RepID=UPI001C4366FC